MTNKPSLNVSAAPDPAVNCGYYMSGDPDAYDECLRGYLTKDRDAGRFGSALGDDDIEVFRATRKDS